MGDGARALVVCAPVCVHGVRPGVCARGCARGVRAGCALGVFSG